MRKRHDWIPGELLVVRSGDEIAVGMLKMVPKRGPLTVEIIRNVTSQNVFSVGERISVPKEDLDRRVPPQARRLGMMLTVESEHVLYLVQVRPMSKGHVIRAMNRQTRRDVDHMIGTDIFLDTVGLIPRFVHPLDPWRNE